ncbi:hypothetical protein P692DRAFT_20822683 [Suillus brevipes Sb2]|jgi:hypothetical protein|nr:hypothetical protein P692DRAFT_20822683 [Suillus brevipes Sb2]
MRDNQLPASTTHCGRGNHLHDINNIISSIPSARRRTRLQTTAYLLGARKELPEVNDEEINRIRAIQMCYSPEANTNSTEEQARQGPDQPQAAFLEKGDSNCLLK